MEVIHLVNNRVWGGGEQYVADLAAAVRARGHRVRVLSRADAPDVARRIKADATLRLGGWTDFGTSRRLAAMIAQSGADKTVVHVHNFKTARHAVRAKRLLRGRHDVRVVLTRHLVKPGKADFLTRRLYRDLDAVVFVSQLAMDSFMSSGPQIDAAKMRVVHNAVPGAVSDSVPHVDTDCPVIGFMGRLSPEKGVDVLLQALSQLRHCPWRLRIAGTGNPQYVEKLKALARTLDVDSRVEWTGFVEDTDSFLDSLHVGVFPSVWPEPFGLVLLDYMRHGLAVVSTNAGAQSEILSNGTDGLLVPVDAVAMADALRSVLTDATLRARLGRGALETARRFGYDKFVDRILETYG